MLEADLARTPIHFGAVDAPLFGWYHGSAAPRPCGVVLCNPLGHELVRAHRAYRHLAERLAAAGFPVLRFDYRGTGDSSGDDRDPDRVPGFVADIGSAIKELETRSGVKAVCLVGLRLGATLAMLAAAERGGVESLVLWAPCLTGDAYVGEMKKLQAIYEKLERRGPPRPEPGDDVEESLGHVMTRATVAALRQIDLFQVTCRPAARALVIGTGRLLAEAPLVDHLEALGTLADRTHLPGHKFLSTIPQDATVPDAELDEIVAWLDAAHPVDAEGALARPAAPPAPPGGRATIAGARGALSLVETPLFFGGERRLFGIVTQPASPTIASRAAMDAGSTLPGILLLNAGCVYRIGPTRNYVAMARRWAELGFSVLRFDISGLGDSPAAPGSPENLCYPAAGLSDIDAAMQAMSARANVDRFVLIGVCSGADHTLQMARSDPRVVGAVIINPRTFFIYDNAEITAHQHARYYEGRASSKEAWTKLLTGKVQYRRILALLGGRAKRLVQHALEGALRAARSTRTGTARDNVATRLRATAERGVNTLLFCSERDPGVDYADAHLGEEMRALASVPGFRREELASADHIFTDAWAQRAASDRLTEHLQSYLEPPWGAHDHSRLRGHNRKEPADPVHV